MIIRNPDETPFNSNIKLGTLITLTFTDNSITSGFIDYVSEHLVYLYDFIPIDMSLPKRQYRITNITFLTVYEI